MYKRFQKRAVRGKFGKDPRGSGTQAERCSGAVWCGVPLGCDDHKAYRPLKHVECAQSYSAPDTLRCILTQRSVNEGTRDILWSSIIFI